jgi:hypothetical protein
MKYHNVRNSKGQFTRKLKVARAKDGKFSSPYNIVAGRLYDYKGAVVRAGQKGNGSYRRVSFHKTLTGIVKDCELKKVNKSAVEAYLSNAQ